MWIDTVPGSLEKVLAIKMLLRFGLACAIESIRKRKGTDRASIYKTRCF